MAGRNGEVFWAGLWRPPAVTLCIPAPRAVLWHWHCLGLAFRISVITQLHRVEAMRSSNPCFASLGPAHFPGCKQCWAEGSWGVAGGRERRCQIPFAQHRQEPAGSPWAGWTLRLGNPATGVCSDCLAPWEPAGVVWEGMDGTEDGSALCARHREWGQQLAGLRPQVLGWGCLSDT